MPRIFFTITALLVFVSSTTFAQTTPESTPDVVVSATLKQQGPVAAELIVTAAVKDGLHIYGPSQPKPFLPMSLTVDPIQGVHVGEFIADAEPVIRHRSDLDVDLHEYFGTAVWRATVQWTNAGNQPPSVRGKLFAQACGDEACFAPQTYTFVANHQAAATTSETIASPATISAESENAAFSLANLQVAPEANKRSVWTVLPLAMIAGFLLNFMPCVLPVVGLKLLSFVQQANSDRKQILLMNLAYTAGLLSVMMVLATMAVFAGLGWGEQFSSVGFTVTLAAIVFAFGLSFLGVWEIPLPGFVGSASGSVKQEGYGGAFSKGILSTLLATPCSGPFLGAALAWAVTQSAYLTYAVFAAVGIGMASPYLVIGLFPSLIRFLPKPGNWMVLFKQIMGFVMLATVVYLISFMPVAAVVPTVMLLLGIGVAVWMAGQTPPYASITNQVKAWSIAAAMIVVTSVFSFGWLQSVMQSRFERAAERWISNTQTISFRGETEPESVTVAATDHIAWQTFTPERLETLIGQGKPVFVDFTADWCLTCKSNEAAAIETAEVIAAMNNAGVVPLRADKTEANPEVDQLLRQLGNSAASIPFYAFFPADDPNQPILMDGIYTGPGPFLDAIERSKSGAMMPKVMQLKVTQPAVTQPKVTQQGVPQ